MIGRDPFFGLIALVAAVIISRVIMEKALKRLRPDEKAKLLDAFSGYRIYNYAVILILMVFYFGAMRYFPESASAIAPMFLILFLLVTITISVLSYRKLKGLGLPPQYVKNYLISLAVQYAGIAFLFAPSVARYAR
ncbi:MAG: hypothetical protein QOD75_3803 [Blastocatellia bacterium]|jgi:cobalamin synthase|nr:hypothetical protein [Blastocatellia bacterium]